MLTNSRPSTLPTQTTTRSVLLMWLAPLLICASPFASAQWLAGASAETLFNDNVTRSPYPDHALSDKSLDVSLWRGYHLQLAEYTALLMQGSLSHQQFDHFSALSNTRLSGSAELSHKFGLGANTPVLAFTAVIERSLFNDTHRDQSLYRTSVSLRQRIQEQWQLAITATHEHTNGDYGQNIPLVPPAPPLPTNVWDLGAWQLAVNAEWDIGPASWLSATVSWRNGDIVASTPPYPKILDASSAIAFDPVFGAGVVAYRMAATTRSITLDWNHAVGDSSTLYVGGERQWTRGEYGLEYPVHIIRAGFLHNF